MATYVIGAMADVTVTVEASSAEEALTKAREMQVHEWELDCSYPSWPEILEGPEDESEQETE